MSWLIAQMSDLHLVAPGRLCMGKVDTAAKAQAAVQRLADLEPRPDVLVLSGDISDDGSVAAYDHLAACLHPLVMDDLKLVVAMGNHDDRAALRASRLWGLVAAQPGLAQMDASGDHDAPGAAEVAAHDQPLAYQLRLCAEPGSHASQASDLRIIVLDSWQPQSSAGALGDLQLAGLQTMLEQGEQAGERPSVTVLVVHHPPFATGIAGMDRIGLLDRNRLLPLITADRLTLVLSGHCHRPISTVVHGVPAVVAPSTAHQIPLDLRDGQPAVWNLEPPAMLLHRIDAGGVVSHLLPIAQQPAHSFRA